MITVEERLWGVPVKSTAPWVAMRHCGHFCRRRTSNNPEKCCHCGGFSTRCLVCCVGDAPRGDRHD